MSQSSRLVKGIIVAVFVKHLKTYQGKTQFHKEFPATKQTAFKTSYNPGKWDELYTSYFASSASAASLRAVCL